MKLINDTGHVAELFRSESKEDLIHASLLVRTRHRIELDGTLTPTTGDDRLEDIRRDRIEDDYGTIEPDLGFGRVATDVIVMGDAVSTQGEVTAMRVDLAVGPYIEALRVVGDRVWELDPGTRELVATRPAPFARMPVTWANAYGGRAHTEYGDLLNPNNPVGKGYARAAEDAVGKPLPNIEDPAAPVRRWSDTPEPVGFAPYPTEWALRLMRVCVANERTRALELKPEEGLFDRAHPRLSGREVRAGEVFSLRGMSERGEIRFVIPPCPVEAIIQVGEREITRALTVEEVLVDTRKRWVECSYRKLFRYTVYPGELRRTTLCAAGSTGAMELAR